MTCLGLLGLALVARPALAADNCVAPPGTSGIDQYCEALPNPGGSSHHGSNGGGSAGSQLPLATKRTLARQGAVGAAVLSLTRQGGVQAGALQKPPRSNGGSKKHSRAHSGTVHRKSAAAPHPAAAQASIPAAPASNPVAAVGNSVSIGAGLLAVLLAAGAIFSLLAWVRWRRHSSAGPT